MASWDMWGVCARRWCCFVFDGDAYRIAATRELVELGMGLLE